MSFGISLNGHTGADSSEIKAIAEEAYQKLKALPGAVDIKLTGWANEATGGSITLSNPIESEPSAAEVAEQTEGATA